jgi:cell division protein FtsA
VQSKQLFALDLGTTKFCLAALIWGSGAPKLELVEVPADGMHRGMVSDFSKAERCIKDLIEKAEKQLNVLIDKVIVGVAGSHLRSTIVEHALTIPHQPVQTRHLKRLLEEVETKAETPFRELLHCVPIAYRIDSREETSNPVGFTASSLSGRYFVIDADKDYLRDIIRVCNANGLEVMRLFSEPFASASVCVADEAKQLGMAIADIGGGTTDGVIFQNGKPVKAFTINIAGSMMTRDIAVGLNVSIQEAEQLKHTYGLKYYDTPKELRHQLDPLAKKVFIVLGSRIHELGAHLANDLLEFRGQLGAGILLTGGGSQVIGIDRFLADRFKVQVKVAPPQLSVDQMGLGVHTTRHATALGLLNLELGRRVSAQQMNGSWSRRYLDQFVNWIRELS